MSDPATALAIVTISATYGSGGSVVAPQLAQRLGVPFYDRLLQGTGPDVEPSERISDDERALLPLGRLLTGFAFAPEASYTSALRMPMPDEDGARRSVEKSVALLLERREGVLLGRAGAVVLAGEPGVFHVRLDGPVDRRIRSGMRFEGIDEKTARRHLEATDKARTDFVKRVYGRDPRDVALYHLILDGTAFRVDDSVELLAQSARLFWKSMT
jgi:cytidylate kinase